MPTLPGPLQETECAGHRVLRVLGRSDSATVLLGHDGEASEPVVLKVVASTERAGRELEALDRAAGDHVVRVADVADLDGGGVAIVLDRLALGDLASLLFRRARWSLGEVVTVIAPIAQTLHRLHDAGVAHGAVRPSSIVFDAEGAPVLVGFGSATFFPPGLPEVSREGLEGVRADREALRRSPRDS